MSVLIKTFRFTCCKEQLQHKLRSKGTTTCTSAGRFCWTQTGGITHVNSTQCRSAQQIPFLPKMLHTNFCWFPKIGCQKICSGVKGTVWVKVSTGWRGQQKYLCFMLTLEVIANLGMQRRDGWAAGSSAEGDVASPSLPKDPLLNNC